MNPSSIDGALYFDDEKIELSSANYVNVPQMAATGVSSLGNFNLASNTNNQARLVFDDFICTLDHELIQMQGAATQVYRIDFSCTGERRNKGTQRGWMSISRNANQIIRASSPICADGNSEYQPHNTRRVLRESCDNLVLF